jgi:energy-coupling factor transporter ATP-binding protein EcfA2
VRPGPVTTEQLNRFGRNWKQGEHVFVSGPTGSGKTALTRHILEKRVDRGGYVMTLFCKLKPDDTITTDYADFQRWKTWKRWPSARQHRILLWPDTDKYRKIADKKALQRDVFSDALERFANDGRWTIHIDEGLYMCNPSFMGLSDDLALLHAMGRSSKASIVTCTQRPSHLPLIIYSSASHAFVGRARETADAKRLGELGSREGSRKLQSLINDNQRHDFQWIPVGPDWPAEKLNLAA